MQNFRVQTFEKGQKLKKYQMIFFFFKFSSFIKYSIHHPLSADTSFKFLAILLLEIRHLQKLHPFFLKGPLFLKGEIIQGKPKICAGYFSVH